MNDQEINSFVTNSKCVSRQSFILRKDKFSKISKKIDLYGLLERLNITNDIDLQLKVFASLSAYLLFNKGANFEVIIKCTGLYDKIGNVLSKGLARKSTETLNFLMTLLYIDGEEDVTSTRVTLAMYAQNMTRVSGCLSTMCEMFTNCMMFHDTWKSLCHCLAVACSGCEMNQSYCSHLVPVCIQKSSAQNIEIFVVLQSLMLNHNRNIQLFLDCKGIFIFPRELLHYDKCLQLLMIVVQFSPTPTKYLRQTNVLEDLRDFLRLYGPNSQLGQKATLILNHIHSSSKGTMQNQKVTPDTKLSKNKSDTITKNPGTELEETSVLMRNVMKEVFIAKQTELKNSKQADSQQTNDNQMNSFSNKNINKINKHINEIQRTKQDYVNETGPFSFLDNDFKVPKPNHIVNGYTATRKNDFQRTNPDTRRENSLCKTSDEKNDKHKIYLQEFNPIFSSTLNNKTESVNNNNTSAFSRKLPETQPNPNKHKDLINKRNQLKNNMSNRNLGARFFHAINDSCTTLVRTVKNIFNNNVSNPECSKSSRIEHTPKRDKRSNSSFVSYMRKRDKRSNFSFVSYMRKRDKRTNSSVINYMRKRDALLNKRSSEVSDHSNVTVNSCKTCNDTQTLKQKLTRDKFLRLTVKKLKLGIRLYGCDFKKISMKLWPRESYMTPLVLYNLYRKLLLK